ncbi:MAG: biotin transporter BioY, partial [Gemmatimonadaceae bacterium]
MTSSSIPVARNRRITAIGIVGFAAALAAASQVALPVPGTPVPVTLQPLAVVLAGLWLGPVAGAASMVLYLAAGALGLPVFAPMGPPGVVRLFGPTGGYLWAYPVAAWIAGTIGARLPGFWGRALASAAGIAMLHVGGVLQLAALTGSVGRAVTLG